APDAGQADDAGAPPDAGSPNTCALAGEDCRATCASGHAPRSDLSCGSSGLVCCAQLETSCPGVPDACEHCGQLYPATCVGTTWTCEDRGSCESCNVDSECPDRNLCEHDFETRTGRCTPCPEVDALPCTGGTLRSFEYGNGCS